MVELCSHGHALTKSNRTKDGKCAKCEKIRADNNGVSNKYKTHCRYGHPLSGDNVQVYTDLRGNTRRRCLRCHAERSRAYYYNKLRAIKHPRKKPGRPRKY